MSNSAHVRQVSMDCTEVDDGYKVRYTPLSPGQYFIAIKYDGYHIVGSPFKAEATGEAHGHGLILVGLV